MFPVRYELNPYILFRRNSMTELNGDKSEEDRIMAITKITSILMKQNGR
jgi:hypothetical protein